MEKPLLKHETVRWLFGGPSGHLVTLTCPITWAVEPFRRERAPNFGSVRDKENAEASIKYAREHVLFSFNIFNTTTQQII